MPAPRKPSPSSPATNRTTPGGPATLKNPAVAARVRAGNSRPGRAPPRHRRVPRPPRRRPANPLDALLLEAIAALASLLGAPGPHPAAQPQHRHQHLPEHEHRMLPNHVQTPRPLTALVNSGQMSSPGRWGVGGGAGGGGGGAESREEAGAGGEGGPDRNPGRPRPAERLRARNRCLARASPVPSVTAGATAGPPPSAAGFRCVSLTLRSHPKTSNLFPEFGGMFMAANRTVPDQPRAGQSTDRHSLGEG